MPHWRKATWAVVIWAALFGLTLASGINVMAESVAYMGGPLLLVWLLSRPKKNTVVFDRRGEQSKVSERDAKRRVDQEGWTYERPSERPSEPS